MPIYLIEVKYTHTYSLYYKANSLKDAESVYQHEHSHPIEAHGRAAFVDYDCQWTGYGTEWTEESLDDWLREHLIDLTKEDE